MGRLIAKLRFRIAIGWAMWLAAQSSGNYCFADPPRALAPFDAEQARTHQEAWAKHLSTTVEATNTIGLKLVLIPPGEFLMGSTPAQVQKFLEQATEYKIGADRQYVPTEGPQHRVVLTRPFRLSATEITVGQFSRFLEATGYKTETERLGGGNTHRRTISKADSTKEYVYDPKLSYAAPGYPVTDDSPATQVTWNDAVAFSNWLTQQEQTLLPLGEDVERSETDEGSRANRTNLDSQPAQTPSSALRAPSPRGRRVTYRLPTEAEWEFACRAGTTTDYSHGDDLDQLGDFAWYGKNTSGRSEAVGTKRANPFGLFDMHGNTREWCADWFAKSWYKQSPLENPTGPETGTGRVLRGGKWLNKPPYLRSSFRFDMSPTYRSQYFGFRVAAE